VKKLLIATALIVALIPFAVAQDNRAPQASLDRHVDVRIPARAAVLGHEVRHQEPNGPKYCRPCLFYAGDMDPNNQNTNGLANEVDITISTGAAVYAPFIVPVNKTWTVTGLFTNNFLSAGVLDPATSPYEVRKGIPKAGGTGGTLVCHGKLASTATATGRNDFGFNEYTVAVKGIKNCTLSGGSVKGGKKYWESVVPYCTNTGDNNCTNGYRGFESNDEDVPALNHFGLNEPANDSFFNSVFFGATWSPTSNFQGSTRFSDGVSGTSN
jgi:hypothetical protein